MPGNCWAWFATLGSAQVAGPELVEQVPGLHQVHHDVVRPLQQRPQILRNRRTPTRVYKDWQVNPLVNQYKGEGQSCQVPGGWLFLWGGWSSLCHRWGMHFSGWKNGRNERAYLHSPHSPSRPDYSGCGSCCSTGQPNPSWGLESVSWGWQSLGKKVWYLSGMSETIFWLVETETSIFLAFS